MRHTSADFYKAAGMDDVADEMQQEEIAMEEKRAPSNERKQLMRLAGAADVLCRLDEAHAFAGRDALIKTQNTEAYEPIASRIHDAAESCLKMIGDITATIPNEQRMQMKQEMRRVRVYVRCERIDEDVHADRTDGRWLCYDDIAWLFTAAREACIACSGTGAEYNACKYRKVFDKISTLGDEEQQPGKCPYALI